MGGLYQEQTIQNEKGIPWLMDIPVAGRLFQSKTLTKEKRDLLIEVRPTILVPGKDSFLPVPLTRPTRADRAETSEVRSGARGATPLAPAPEPAADRSRSSPREPSRRRSSGDWY